MWITQNIFDNPWLKKLLELKEIEMLDRNIIVEMINQITVYENHKIKISYNFGDDLENLFTTVYETDKNI